MDRAEVVRERVEGVRVGGERRYRGHNLPCDTPSDMTMSVATLVTQAAEEVEVGCSIVQNIKVNISGYGLTKR